MNANRLRMVSAIAVLGAVALTAACGADDRPGASPAPTAAVTPTAGPVPSAAQTPSRLPATAGTTTVPGTTHGSVSPWSSAPLTVVHRPAVPPVPVITRVRSAAHPDEGFDRIVFDIEGGVPGYTVRYVDQVRADPSDKPVTVPGRRFLLLVFTPAQAHRDSGSTTITGTHRLGLSMMRGYAVVGDFEGYVSVAIGLDDVVGYRVGELPGRIYLDVAA